MNEGVNAIFRSACPRKSPRKMGDTAQGSLGDSDSFSVTEDESDDENEGDPEPVNVVDDALVSGCIDACDAACAFVFKPILKDQLVPIMREADDDSFREGKALHALLQSRIDLSGVMKRVSSCALLNVAHGLILSGADECAAP